MGDAREPEPPHASQTGGQGGAGDDAAPKMRRSMGPAGWLIRLSKLNGAVSLIPELRHCRTEFELIEASARSKGSPGMREAVPVLLCVAIVATMVMAWPSMRPPTMPGWLVIVPVMVLMGALVLVVALMTRDQARRRVRAYLLSRGVALCSACGYDVRGLKGAHAAGTAGGGVRCPECGTELPAEVLAVMGRPGAPG